jgi:cellulose synthase/poly-beta-1,6-N-acetylglucosamine synthase-like glycosyltransferase
MHLSSGEDELLMQKISRETDYSVKFIWEMDSVVTTKPNDNMHDFIQQRKRWASKGLFYKDKLLIAKLALIYLFFVSLIAQLVLAIILSKIFFLSFVISLLLKFIFEYKVISKGVDFLFPRKLMKYFFLTEIFQSTYIVVAGVQGLFGNFNWKGRNLTR